MHIAFPYQFADDEQEASTTVAGLLVHLDTIYGFALTLTGDADAAAELTRSADDERVAIVAALEQTDGAIARAAELLGMGRTTLWRKLKQYGLTSDAS